MGAWSAGTSVGWRAIGRAHGPGLRGRRLPSAGIGPPGASAALPLVVLLSEDFPSQADDRALPLHAEVPDRRGRRPYQYNRAISLKLGLVDAPAMKKRVAAGMLWFYVAWYAWALIANAVGVTDLAGPIIGLVAAALVAGDPLGRESRIQPRARVDGHGVAVGRTQADLI